MIDGVETQIGDLVIYRNRTSLERSDLVGLVIGSHTSTDVYVLWMNPSGKMSLDQHQTVALKVLERPSITTGQCEGCQSPDVG